MYSRIGSLAKTALPFFVALMGVAGIFAPTAYGDEIAGVNSSFSDTAKLAQAETQPPGEKTSDPAQGSNQAEKSKNKSALLFFDFSA